MPEQQTVVQSIGLSIGVWKPSIVAVGAAYSYTPRGQLINDALEERASAYDHTISAEIGFDAATITLEGEQEYIEEWIAEGLNRHIEVSNPELDTVWSGFVNSYSANLGSLTKNGGPVLDIVNRCVVSYTPMDYNANPPARGPVTETIAADDSDSQLLYGVVEAMIQGGEDTSAGAEQTRDTQLRDLAWPKGGTSISVGRTGQAASITLECLGYGARLDTYIFNDATTGASAISDKIARALTADPNGLFSTDTDHIESNAFLLAATERDNKTAWAVIKKCLEVGTATDLRTFFGVYEGQVAHYWSEPMDILYKHRIADIAQDVEAHAGSVPTAPWDVRPGQWLFSPDFLAGRQPPPVDLRRDPRIFLVESVKFGAPYQVEVNGERFGSVPQLLAKKGLGGM